MVFSLLAATLPAAIANYRSWTKLTPEPTRIPYALAALCMPPAEMQIEQSKKTYGPHTDRWVLTYANAVAVAGLKAKGPFPAGAVLVKEKRRQPNDEKPEAVAYMIKRAKGGWEFAYYPSSPGASYEHCAQCHRAGAARDSVFSR